MSSSVAKPCWTATSRPPRQPGGPRQHDARSRCFAAGPIGTGQVRKPGSDVGPDQPTGFSVPHRPFSKLGTHRVDKIGPQGPCHGSITRFDHLPGPIISLDTPPTPRSGRTVTRLGLGLGAAQPCPASRSGPLGSWYGYGTTPWWYSAVISSTAWWPVRAAVSRSPASACAPARPPRLTARERA